MAEKSEHPKPINFRPINGTRLFRSSRPDCEATSDIFKSSGIKTMIDLRDRSEIYAAHCCKDYQLVTAESTSIPDEPIELKPIAQPKKNQVEEAYFGKHVVLSLINTRRVIAYETGCTKSNVMCLYWLDMLLCCTRLARSYFIRNVLTRKGQGDESLLWLYKHIVDNGKDNICKGKMCFRLFHFSY